MSNPPIPDDPRFRTHKYTGGDGVTGTVNQFLCGDNVWRCIVELKAHDGEHGTHFADDCANAARIACEDECLELQEGYSVPYQSGADADAAQDADRLDKDANDWDAWGKDSTR